MRAGRSTGNPVRRLTAVTIVLCAVFAPFARADQTQDLLSLRNTLVGVLEELVKSGVIKPDEARKIVDKAEADALAEASKQRSTDAVNPNTVRVAYVPEIVKDQLRAQIKEELAGEVTQDVLDQAHHDGWGVPGALPAWIGDMKWHADMRVRSNSVLFASNNAQGFYLNFQAINQAGGIGPAGQNAFLNVSEDEHQMNERMRFGVDTRVADGWTMGVRVSTGNDGNPVTRNVNVAQYNAPWNTYVDLAYLEYATKNVVFVGGRFLNPYLSTNLVYDDDLTFEGLAVTGMLPFELFGADDRAFLTVGYFPLDQINLSSRDKYLFGSQLGTQFAFGQSSLGIGIAYYDFANLNGTRNTPGSTKENFTAPAFVQKGNTMFDILNDNDPNTGLYALAAQYQLEDVSFVFDSGPLSESMHLRFTGDFVRNVGYSESDVFRATGVRVPGKTDGYQFQLSVGAPDVNRFGLWRIAALYRHVERDAVVDAFTDSDFHQGGTDAEGWGIEALYGLARNTWMRVSYLTANEIDGPPLGIDLLQVDLNAKF